MAVTVAFPTAAPLESFTLPTSDPYSTWAGTRPGARRINVAIQTAGTRWRPSPAFTARKPDLSDGNSYPIYASSCGPSNQRTVRARNRRRGAHSAVVLRPLLVRYGYH